MSRGNLKAGETWLWLFVQGINSASFYQLYFTSLPPLRFQYIKVWKNRKMSSLAIVCLLSFHAQQCVLAELHEASNRTPTNYICLANSFSFWKTLYFALTVEVKRNHVLRSGANHRKHEVGYKSRQSIYRLSIYRKMLICWCVNCRLIAKS